MIELLKKDQPAVARMLDAPLEKAKNIQRAFLYATRARYVKALKERGGWEAVNSAYRFPPSSTAAILHPEGVTAIDLGPGKVKGELHLITILAANEATAPQATTAAAGWKGDRLRELDGGSTWTLAFATQAAAQRCRDALVRLQFAENPDLKKVDGDAWKKKNGSVVAIRSNGPRMLVIDAKDEANYQALHERLFGPLLLTVYDTKEKKQITFGELIDRLMHFDLVCIGETHDSDYHHRVQLQVIKALYARDERLGVGMEMFQRPFQEHLDRYGRGELIDEELLQQTEYRQRWGYDWSLYRAIVSFCRANGIPIAALNAPKELTQKISKGGHASLTDDEKKQLGPIDFQVKVHRDYWFERLAAMHGNTKVPEDRKERLLSSDDRLGRVHGRQRGHVSNGAPSQAHGDPRRQRPYRTRLRHPGPGEQAHQRQSRDDWRRNRQADGEGNRRRGQRLRDFGPLRSIKLATKPACGSGPVLLWHHPNLMATGPRSGQGRSIMNQADENGPSVNPASTSPSWLGTGGKRSALIWGVVSTLLSAIGLIGLALFEQYNGALTELRTDLKHFNDTCSEYVKKDKLQKCWDMVKDCSKEIIASNAAHDRFERELQQSERARRIRQRDPAPPGTPGLSGRNENRQACVRNHDGEL